MANAAITPIRSGPPPGSDGDIPVQHTDFDARGFGRRFPQTDVPEGWVFLAEQQLAAKPLTEKVRLQRLKETAYLVATWPALGLG